MGREQGHALEKKSTRKRGTLGETSLFAFGCKGEKVTGVQYIGKLAQKANQTA